MGVGSSQRRQPWTFCRFCSNAAAQHGGMLSKQLRALMSCAERIVEPNQPWDAL